jgi:hypothetical protein
MYFQATKVYVQVLIKGYQEKMVKCYYPGCIEHGNTKEHIPPKSFFPDEKKIDLMTVKSCPKHNNEKTKDDIYVLAQICYNVIRDVSDLDATNVFENKVFPQLKHNNSALERTIMRNRVRIPGGYEFPVDVSRMDAFFDCLTHGILFKKIKKKVDLGVYRLRHVYRDFGHKFGNQNDEKAHEEMLSYMDGVMLGDTLSSINFSFLDRKLKNQEIYSVKIIGADSLIQGDELTSSITVVHTFYEKFRVISLLTRVANFEQSAVHIASHPD